MRNPEAERVLVDDPALLGTTGEDHPDEWPLRPFDAVAALVRGWAPVALVAGAVVFGAAKILAIGQPHPGGANVAQHGPEPQATGSLVAPKVP